MNISARENLREIILLTVKSGIDAKKIQTYYYTWVSNNNKINISFSKNVDAKFRFESINLGILSKKSLEKFCQDVTDAKEIVFEYIKTLSLEEKILVLTNATVLSEPEHPLYTFFHIQRGSREPAPHRGMLGMVHVELKKSLEQKALGNKNEVSVSEKQKITANKSSDKITDEQKLKEEEELQLALALSESESFYQKEVKVREFNQVHDNVEQFTLEGYYPPFAPEQSVQSVTIEQSRHIEVNTEDLISFDIDNKIQVENVQSKTVISNEKFDELFGQVEFKEQIEIVVPAHHLDGQEYELPPELSDYQVIIKEEQYEMPPPLVEINQVEIKKPENKTEEVVVKEVEEKKSVVVKEVSTVSTGGMFGKKEEDKKKQEKKKEENKRESVPTKQRTAQLS